MQRVRNLFVGCLIVASLCVFPARAEVLEEIVARVEGDIITLSEYRQEEAALTQELYSRFTGEELDKVIAAERKALLLRMIDNKILLRRAERMFDLDQVGSSYLDSFRKQQGLETDEALENALSQQGLTVEDLKRFLVARYAPEEILRIEVRSRVSISDQEMETFYAENPAMFEVPAEVTFREIVLLAEGSEKEQRRTEMEDLRAKATAEGADFEALAREHSEAGTAEDGGKLGPMKQDELSEALSAVVFHDAVGSVSSILEMPYGFHMVKIEERAEARMRSLDEVREALRSQMENQKYGELLREFLTKARDEADWSVAKKYEGWLPG
ncbi:hypothetical protein ABI59_14775 [Acidobacteria bacterium Mor1]|nr:hypothetical protein ABI59_14775 [Acidobacteria bacterium Mor1]